MTISAEQLHRDMESLAQEGAWIGTSSWKYPGWQGLLYDRDRYVYRGKYSESRFERLCLAEYATVFKTVCVDAAYYQFPSERWLESLVSQVGTGFQFTFKVTDQITIKRFPKLDRFGSRAGQQNPYFLDASVFEREFLKPCEPFRSSIGLLMFEFSRFNTADFARGRDFVETLGRFLSALPGGWSYGVEIRNRHFLKDEYFAMLSRHGVAHVFNSWQDMPSIEEQVQIPGAWTNPNLFVARLLLRPGRKYEEAVKMFAPYDQVKDPYPEGRVAGAKLVQAARRSGGKTRGYIYVNNRFEGNALDTIAGIAAQAAKAAGQ